MPRLPSLQKLRAFQEDQSQWRVKDFGCFVYRWMLSGTDCKVAPSIRSITCATSAMIAEDKSYLKDGRGIHQPHSLKTIKRIFNDMVWNEHLENFILRSQALFDQYNTVIWNAFEKLPFLVYFPCLLLRIIRIGRMRSWQGQLVVTWMSRCESDGNRRPISLLNLFLSAKNMKSNEIKLSVSQDLARRIEKMLCSFAYYLSNSILSISICGHRCSGKASKWSMDWQKGATVSRGANKWNGPRENILENVERSNQVGQICYCKCIRIICNLYIGS